MGSKGDHSALSSYEVNSKWRCLSTSPIRLHGVDRDTSNFTFTTFYLLLPQRTL